MKHFHGVRFYESRESMAATAAVFLGAGLIVDETVLVIARRTHRAALESALREISFSLATLQTSQKLHILDVEHTVRALAVNGAVDPRRFTAVIAGRIGGFSPERHVRVYDEMTDVLRDQGQHDAAMQVEALWDRYTFRGTCSVLCGHRGNRESPAPGVDAICSCHSHILAPDGVPHPIARVRAAIAVRDTRGSRSVH